MRIYFIERGFSSSFSLPETFNRKIPWESMENNFSLINHSNFNKSVEKQFRGHKFVALSDENSIMMLKKSSNCFHINKFLCHTSVMAKMKKLSPSTSSLVTCRKKNYPARGDFFSWNNFPRLHAIKRSWCIPHESLWIAYCTAASGMTMIIFVHSR